VIAGTSPSEKSRCDLGRAEDGVAIVGKELEQLRRGAEDALAVAAPLALARLERGVVADRDEDVLERGPAGMVRVDVAGDERPDPGVLGEVAQERVPAGVAALERPLQLDEEAVGPERPHQLDGAVRVADAEPVACTAGEADETLVQLRQQRLVERRRQQLAFLRPRVCVRRGEEPAEVGVALGGLDEQRHVRASDERDLGAGDRADTEVLRRLCELERAEDALVVGERERLVPELRRPQRQLLGVRRAVEERIG
jgi:hypothetical protein